LEGEIRFHLERQVEAYLRAGLTRVEAERRARLEFGGLERLREEHRDTRGVGVVDDFTRDGRYAIRQLRRSPGFALAALLCLGLGIGATTAIASVVNAVLLQPLPFPESDRFVRLDENTPPPAPGRPPMQRGLTHAEFLEWRAQSKTFSEAKSLRRTTGAGESRLRAALVVGQLVMATILLVSAGLLAHSVVKLSNVNNGYDPNNVLAFNLLLPDHYSIARKVETIDRLLVRLRDTASVRATGFSRHGLLVGEELFIGSWVPPGRGLEDVRELRTRVRSVSDGFLTAMGVPVLEGREFDSRDLTTSTAVVVMSRAAARQYFGDVRPVGRTIDWHFADGYVQPMNVIGVVDDIRQESPTDEVFPEIFVNYRQYLQLMETSGQKPQRQNELAIGFLSFAIRTTGDPASLVPEVRHLVNNVDPNVGIDALVPMTRLTASAVAPQRFYAVMLGAFALVAAVLAAIGVYGVLTYAAIQRTQEIGVRVALGARRTEVLALILRGGLVLTTTGIAIGLVGAAIGTRVLQSLLFGITPLDVRTFLAVTVMFGIVATAACYLPARRATKIDALVALRNQ
jgi:putative ABC transport system permease protein